MKTRRHSLGSTVNHGLSQPSPATRWGMLLALVALVFTLTASLPASAQIGSRTQATEPPATEAPEQAEEAAAAAAVEPTSAYVWANEPSSDSYTPNEMYQYNSTGELNTVTRTGVGAYTVNLPGMTPNGNVQVTATSSSDAGIAAGQVCAIASEPAAAQPMVACVDAEGSPADSGFLLLYTAGESFLGWNAAYVFGYDMVAESYTPAGETNFNITGEPNTITRSEAGIYIVTMPGLGFEEGNVQVTAANINGDNPVGTDCTVGNWNLDDAGNKTVTVMCFDSTGALTDSTFMLLYVTGDVVAGAGTESVAAVGGGAWVTDAASPVGEPITLDAAAQFTSGTGPITAIHTAVGSYAVTMPGLGADSGSIQVTPVRGTNSDLPVATGCVVLTTEIVKTDMVVTLQCFDGEGALADSGFTVTYVSLPPSEDEATPPAA